MSEELAIADDQCCDFMSWGPSSRRNIPSEGTALITEDCYTIGSMSSLSGGESCDDSEEWCDGSVGTLISIGESSECSSLNSVADIVCLDEMSWSHDNEPVPFPFAILPESVKEGLQSFSCGRKTSGPATVVSSTSSSPFHTNFEDDEFWDSAFRGLPTEKEAFDGCAADNASSNPSLGPKPKHCNLFRLLPDEVVCHAFSFADVKTLLHARSVSKRFDRLASRDESGWKDHCTNLWGQKAQVCWRALTLKRNLRSMEAFRVSYQDGKDRQEITPNELCFDPHTGGGTIWHFRFKKSAGAAWTTLDPWYQNQEARKMVFLRDGSVWQILFSKDFKYIAGNNNNPIPSGCFRLKPALFDETLNGSEDTSRNQSSTSRLEMKWRFVLRPMDLPNRPRGSYVRLKMGGRDIPSYVVRRSPTGNWGFVMENCWGVFASFPLPARLQEEITPALALQIQRRREQVPRIRPARIRLRRTSTGIGRWLNVDGIESDSESEESNDDDGEDLRLHGSDYQESEDIARDAALLDDEALPTTNRCQWREALLYNYGATSLPEGEEATAEFDRIFRLFRTSSREQPLEGMQNFLRHHLQLR